MHSPLRLKQAELYGFFVRGELSRLQATVDATLNAVASGRLTLRVISPYVMLTFTRVNHANSTQPVDEAKGWITEVDIVTWILVGQLNQAGKVMHVYWYPCHIFVDDTMALVNGRELFGYPKYLCEYEIPRSDTEPLRCSVSAKGFQSFSRETPSAAHPLLEVTATAPSGRLPRATGALGLFDEALTLLSALPDFFDLDRSAWADLFSLLRHPRIDQIFLKQFPDSAGIKAVYQALVVAPAEVNHIRSGRLLTYDYECTLHAFDSFPLDKTLGLKLGPQEALFPFNVDFDFTAMPGEELVDNSSIAPEKIAILGGGIGSMTTAYYLTDQAGWRNKYDITVYQLGWRLGGKAASGRNIEMGGRVEEHGFHIWFGFYANAFAMIKQAYASLDRPAGSPLATWSDAFKPHDHLALAEEVDGRWRGWSLLFPTRPGEPGEGGEDVTWLQMMVAMVKWIETWIHQLREVAAETEPSPEAPEARHGWLGRVADRAGELGMDVMLLLGVLAGTVGELAPDGKRLDRARHQLLTGTLERLRCSLHRRYRGRVHGNDQVRHLLIGLDLGLTLMKGLFEDGVYTRGFDALNDIDFREWLRKHGGDEELSVNSAPVRGLYNLVFAYEDGDTRRPNIEAGTLLRSMARIGLAYKGGIMYKMQAGMGDTVLTPLYQVLKQRGVKFKFFQRVEELVPDGDTIGVIRLTEQVRLADSRQAYEPLVTVKDLECWPSQPDYRQLDPEQAALLQEKQVNLESSWSNWPRLHEERFGEPLPTTLLTRGVDFDRVVFGISVGALPTLCPRLLELSPALKTLSEKVKTVSTQAWQVWLKKGIEQLGWTYLPRGQGPVLTAFSAPFDTWALMDHLLVREAWPVGHEPKSVSYFCGSLHVPEYPPYSDSDFPGRCEERARQDALHQLTHDVTGLWPVVARPGTFPWQWLVDINDATGPARFDSQFWRVNVDPSERYVMSVVGSTRYRLATDESGFSNLFLTGDWIRTGLNVGCIEAAVMAGMQTSRAMTGHPAVIQGEHDA
ncbi:NAD(P)-binding protein [Corallococcus terminator]